MKSEDIQEYRIPKKKKKRLDYGTIQQYNVMRNNHDCGVRQT